MKKVSAEVLRNRPQMTLLCMTTDQNRHRNTETSKAMRRIAESRRCPQCQRKMALTFYADEYSYGSYCRWETCGYKNITARPWEG